MLNIVCFDILVCYRIKELQLRACTYLGKAFPENLLHLIARPGPNIPLNFPLFKILHLSTLLFKRKLPIIHFQCIVE